MNLITQYGLHVLVCWISVGVRVDCILQNLAPPYIRKYVSEAAIWLVSYPAPTSANMADHL